MAFSRRVVTIGVGVVLVLLFGLHLRSRRVAVRAADAAGQKTVPVCEASSPAPLRSCPVCSASKALAPFADAFKHLDWDALKVERDKLDGQYSGQSLQEYLDILAKYVGAHNLGHPRVDRRPQPLVVDCAKYPAVLTGKKREKPVKVFDLTSFAYELDVLEARMYELQESVDLFVVQESTRNHRGLRKPLFFQENLARYRPFLNRTMYLVLDDATTWKDRQDMMLPQGNPGYRDVPQKWAIENMQRKVLYKKFIEGYGEQNVADDDLIIHGDMDEVPDGDVIYQMKHCETKLPAGFCPQMYTIHFRFPTGRVKTHGYQPGVTSKKQVQTNDNKVLYHFTVPHTIDAGSHLHVGSLALHLYKYLSVGEGGIGRDKPLHFLQTPTGLPATLLSNGQRVCCVNDNKMKAVHDDAHMDTYWKPWFFSANKERFPELFSHNLYYSKDQEGPRLAD